MLLITQLENYAKALSERGHAKKARNVSVVAKRLKKRHGSFGKQVPSLYDDVFGNSAGDVPEHGDDHSDQDSDNISIVVGSFGEGNGGGGGSGGGGGGSQGS